MPIVAHHNLFRNATTQETKVRCVSFCHFVSLQALAQLNACSLVQKLVVHQESINLVAEFPRGGFRKEHRHATWGVLDIDERDNIRKRAKYLRHMLIVGSVWCRDGGVALLGVFSGPQMLHYRHQMPKLCSFACEGWHACER